MMNSSVKILYVILLMLAPCMALAQEVITDHLAKSSNGNVVIVQPDGLRERLKAENGAGIVEDKKMEEARGVGYRIQAYSDSNQRTAKAQAKQRASNIMSRFPDLRTYLAYKSPSWRLKVGDFKTRGEAEQVMHDLKEAFPAYASELKIIVDKINLSE